MPRNSAETRRLILQAADELFYAEGVRAVSVDAISERAGITKRTLYYHFTGKDELIAAYLEARDVPTLSRFQTWFSQSNGSVAERVAGMFRKLATQSQDPKWRGCGFARAAAELAALPGHPARMVASRHKKSFEAWLNGLLIAEGIKDAASLARQIMVLVDGAVTAILIHHDRTYAEAAGRAAATLIASGAARR